MAYVSVPKDLTRVKTKVIFNLTKRQIVCFGGGALIGVPLFFWLRPGLGSSPAAICMMLAMLPFLLLGLYENNGRPLERCCATWRTRSFAVRKPGLTGPITSTVR